MGTNLERKYDCPIDQRSCVKHASNCPPKNVQTRAKNTNNKFSIDRDNL